MVSNHCKEMCILDFIFGQKDVCLYFDKKNWKGDITKTPGLCLCMYISHLSLPLPLLICANIHTKGQTTTVLCNQKSNFETKSMQYQ